MCGIGGVAGRRPVEELRPKVERIVNSLEHRGPDDQGIETPDARGRLEVALCSTRLAVRDLSPLGHQPMVSPRTGLTLAFNGEIYNADSLRRELEGAGHAFRSSGDTEVVLAAFERWGTGAFARLDGMFACAIWDPTTMRLILARDPLGIKPLYYAEESGQLTFASEVRALLAASPALGRLSMPGLASFLATGAVEEPRSILEGVLMLPPGSYLVFDGGLTTVERFWSLDHAFEPSEHSSRAAAVEQVRASLEAALQQQLVSDAPLGVFLSGGLDSSALVGLAAHVAEPPRTASLVFAESELSEAKWIEAVARRWRTDHHQLELSGTGFREYLPSALAAMDQPTVDGVNTYVISQVARHSAGWTVALSGLGGDELFGGYSLYRDVPRLQRLRRLTPTLPAGLASMIATRTVGSGDRGRKMSRWLSGEARSAYTLQRELLDPEICQRLTSVAPDDDILAAEETDLNALSKIDLSHFMKNVLLRDCDALSMAHGLELRVPLLDQQLVELVAGMPAHYKAIKGREKPLLVDAVRDLLPDEVLNRRKMGFTMPFESWLRNELRHEVGRTLLDPDVGGQIGQALDSDAVRSVWDRFERGETNWSRPWALYVGKLWGERHLA